MKKWILIGLGVLVVIIIVGVIVVVSKLGPIIKSAVNTYGPDITKTVLKVDDVGISIFSGHASLDGFLLGNPKGFKSNDAIKVKSITVDVDKNTLTKDTIIINRVEILRPDVTYEKAKGTDNFHAIMQNVQRSVGGDKGGKEKSSDGKPEKKIVIRDLLIRDGKVTLVQDLLVTKQISVPLPEIHLKNVGGEKDGASPGKVADEILKSLYAKITSPAVTAALNDQLKSVTGGATKQVEAGSGKIKGLFGK
jgi:hypothetical protein